MERKTKKYPNLVRTEDGLYFFTDGNGAQAYHDAEPYEFGVARVQKTRGGGWRFRDLDGNLSLESFSWIRSLGNGTWAAEDNNGWRIRDAKGELSEYYARVCDYRQDNLLVQTANDGKYIFIDKKGQSSERFDFATSYDDHGITIVKVEGAQNPQYRDRYGSLSEEFKEATAYNDGFAKVKTLSGKSYYRDMLGRLSSRPTESGRVFWAFAMGNMPISEIPSSCFADSLFGIAVKKLFRIRLEEDIAIGKKFNEPITEKRARKLLIEADDMVQQKTIEAQEHFGNGGLKEVVRKILGKKKKAESSKTESADEDGAEV